MAQRRNPSAGSFNDELERLLEHLAGSALGEVGEPLLSEKERSAIRRKPRIGRSAALHNRFLLDAHAWTDESH